LINCRNLKNCSAKEKTLFEEIYDKIIPEEQGIKLIGIWDKDGLEIDKKIYSTLEKINVEAIGAEIGDIVSRIVEFKFYTSFYIQLNYNNFNLYAYCLSSDYFMIVVAEKNIIPGKLQFYVEKNKPAIIDGLS
jgi:hypothetical protein